MQDDKFYLHNVTTGQTWDYPTEAKLKAVVRLYAVSHPRDELAVTINGRTSTVRGAK